MNEIPWVEKYRPVCFEDIILDDVNKSIFNTILKSGTFPNMIFYGPPGTGKTTTIINLTTLYLQTFYSYKKELVIHLNASDDRGIDIIRNQINMFISTNNLFSNGIKFIILDEVDHMTKCAQQALRVLMNEHSNIRFCLICNYISKIDIQLRNEFIMLQFNILPINKIYEKLKYICDNERIHLSNPNVLYKLQNEFQSDIRSMINYIQLNQDNLHIHDTNININMDDINIDKINELSILSKSNKQNILTSLCYQYILEHDIPVDIFQKIKYIIHKDDICVDTRLQLFFQFIQTQ